MCEFVDVLSSLMHHWVMVRLVIVWINVVALQRAGLVQGWVTVPAFKLGSTNGDINFQIYVDM